MEKVKIIEEMFAPKTGRPPTGLLKVVDHLMSFRSSNPIRFVSAKDISASVDLGATTVRDALRKLESLEYLNKIIINKREYIKERYISTGKSDLHRLPYMYKLSDKFYTDFETRRDNIIKVAQDKLNNCQILERTLNVGIRSHMAIPWWGTWQTDLGRLKIKGGYPVLGNYPDGKIKGSSVGNTLKGTWCEGAKSGSFEFIMANDRISFSGKRFSNIHQRLGEWNGMRVCKYELTCPVAAICTFRYISAHHQG